MNKFLKIMGICAFSAFTTFAYAKEKSKVEIKTHPEEKIGSWALQCETMQVSGKDGEKICALVQNFAILNEKAPEGKKEIPVLRLQVHKVLQDKKTITFLGVRTPLGVDNVPGIKLQIDKKDYKTAPFTTCYAEPLGCRASFLIEDELEKALLKGKELRLGYKSLDGRVIASEVQTNGYTKAISKL